MSGKAYIIFFRDPFFSFIFENGEARTIFISASNRFHILAPKFEILLIPYCVVRMFIRAK